MMYAHAYTLIVMQINTCTHIHIIIVIYTCMQSHTHSHTTSQHIRPSTSTPISYQPLSMVDSSTPRDTIYTVMAARVAEEEQVQRTMIALNDMKPFYPGRQSEEVCSVVDRVSVSDRKCLQPNKLA